MSGSFEISSSAGTYSVEIRQGLFSELLVKFQQDIVIADNFFAPVLSLPKDQVRAILLFESSEAVKSLDFVPNLIEQVRRAGANRQTQFIAIGGGIIQDLAAFAASVYMRGVSWSYVPTTILAMVDSCVGGKSSINVGPYKNLVGTFHPPKAVLVDPSLAATLPLDQQASGIIEAAKICFCRGSEAFHTYLKLDPRPGMDVDTLTSLVFQSLLAKKWFIEIDEFDRKERLFLNFGHTFGHAIEGASHYAISHGIAVGLGILCALDFVRQSSPEIDPYEQTPIVRLLEEHLSLILRSVPGLPASLSDLSLNEVLERFQSDKKHNQENYVLILAEASGQVAIRQVAKGHDTRQRVRSSINHIVDKYK